MSGEATGELPEVIDTSGTTVQLVASENNQGRVFAVKFVQPESGNLFETPKDQLRTRLIPGASVESYGREWRIGRVHIRDDVLTARLGFSGEGGVEEIWDDEAKDFRDQITYRGVTTVFAVHLEQFTGLIQDRSPSIKVDGGLRAVKKILNDGITDKSAQWNVEAYRRKATLSEWRRTVTRVTKVRFSLAEPNPTWQGAKDLEDMFSATSSNSASVVFENALGLNADADFIQQSQHHVDRGYGDGQYTGVIEGQDGEETVSRYNSAVGIEEQNDELAANPNGEVNLDVMRSHLLELPRNSAVATLAAPDDSATTDATGPADSSDLNDRLDDEERVYDERNEVIGDEDPEDADVEHDEVPDEPGVREDARLPESPHTGDTGEGDDN